MTLYSRPREYRVNITMKKSVVLLLVFLTLSTVRVHSAQSSVKVEHLAPQKLEVENGDTQELQFIFQVPEGWYVNANPATVDFLIPTELNFVEKENIEFSVSEYPPGLAYDVPFVDETIKVYGDTFIVLAQITISEQLAADQYSLAFYLDYQACRGEICLAPDTLDFAVETRIHETNENEQIKNSVDFDSLVYYLSVIFGVVLIAGSLRLVWKIMS